MEPVDEDAVHRVIFKCQRRAHRCRAYLFWSPEQVCGHMEVGVGFANGDWLDLVVPAAMPLRLLISEREAPGFAESIGREPTLPCDNLQLSGLRIGDVVPAAP